MFRKVFLKTAPFSIEGAELELSNLDPAYRIIDQFHSGSVEATLEDGTIVRYDCLVKIRAESKQLQVSAASLHTLYLDTTVSVIRSLKNYSNCMSLST